MARLYLGVDGGQSSTTALIGDDSGRVLGTGSAGPCNHVGAAEGPAKLRRTIMECLGLACAQAGLGVDRIEFDAACFGMSGGPADKERLISELVRAKRLVVTDDAEIALSGAFAGGPGVVTIAGTGSISLGRDELGRRARAGGWGYIFGDEGGAFDIVRQALRAVLRFEEGWGENSDLKHSLLQAVGAANANAALHAFYTADWPRSRVAALAPLVENAATNGDAVAGQILEGAGQNLAKFALSAMKQLWLPGTEARFSYIGGVFRSSRVLASFRAAIMSQSGGGVLAPRFGAAEGALLEAYRGSGISPSLDKLLTS